MKSVASALSSTRIRFRRTERIGFGPYLVFEAVPWLLLATVIRIYSHALPDSFLLLGFLVLHVLVFINLTGEPPLWSVSRLGVSCH